jgi:nucleoid DNA-binding protein
MIIKIFLSVIAVLFIAISYELHQIGDVNLRGFGGLMVVLRTIRAVQLSKL